MGREIEMPDPRLVIRLDVAGNLAGVQSDIPLEIFTIQKDGSPRVYRLTEGIGKTTDPDSVTKALGSSPVYDMKDLPAIMAGKVS